MNKAKKDERKERRKDESISSVCPCERVNEAREIEREQFFVNFFFLCTWQVAHQWFWSNFHEATSFGETPDHFYHPRNRANSCHHMAFRQRTLIAYWLLSTFLSNDIAGADKYYHSTTTSFPNNNNITITRNIESKLLKREKCEHSEESRIVKNDILENSKSRTSRKQICLRSGNVKGETNYNDQ